MTGSEVPQAGRFTPTNLRKKEEFLELFFCENKVSESTS